MAGHVQAGDRVDVYVGLVTEQGTTTDKVVGLLSRNVLVLAVPSAEATGGPGQPAGGGGGVVLQVKQSDAPKYAYAAEHGQIWLVLRPQSGAKPTRPLVVDANTVLFGLKPVSVRR
jgi:Flp pilus assembly protein CpaB